jgi:hypothetical protein
LAFSASATPAMAQVGKATVVPAAFGDHSMIQGFALPEEGQGAYVWVYDSAANEILFYHSDGVGPSLHWPLHTETLRDLGVSDDGHFAVLVTNKSVEVHTLERRRPGRAAPDTRARGTRCPDTDAGSMHSGSQRPVCNASGRGDRGTAGGAPRGPAGHPGTHPTLNSRTRERTKCD